MAIIPDLSAQDEHITELDGQEYRLRPTLAFLKKVQDVQDAVSSEKFDEAETAMLQALKAGMLWKHTEEEVETLAKSASMAHLIAFISNVADMEAEADKENFLTPAEERDLPDFDWLGAWASGRTHLGLSDAEFWGLTRRELRALQSANRLTLEFQDWQFASIRYMLYAVNADPKSGNRKTMQDFRFLKDQEVDRTPEQMANNIEAQLRMISEVI